ncbi:MAG: asparagine synthase (glutamine-hydrolyzing) [Candidatus Omnitrophica bacterium]|nr:asparagine synthase (glutamine-hydrolyzing) [Candidatus Omnitrophota bacterium]
MCGIAGFIVLRKTDFDLSLTIQNMANSMAHRGPDDRGYLVLPYGEQKNKSYVALGHRRLKIIDLSQRAHQPMSNFSEKIFISYNGEIYNYIELREELIQKGYNFASRSDTEVVLKAYEEWGTACFKKFNGMWAMAIFDKEKRRIILSRGRFGQKPLYYYKTEKELIFASEIKALLKYPAIIKKPNYEKIFRYIAYNYRYIDIDDSSYFENIYQVPKGSYLEIDEFLNIKESSYWELNPGFMQVSDKKAVRGFKDIFIDAVRLRLRSDVPVGCMLSGGMDSTSITCVAYKVLKKPIVTFSGISGEEKGVYDESGYINSVIKETNAKFHYIRPDPADIFETIKAMLYYHDEPVCTVTWYSLYLIAKKVAKEKIPVILNGHSGDELLAGYWDHYHYNFYDLEINGDIGSLEYERKCWENNHKRDIFEIEKSREYIEKLTNNEVSGMNRFPDYSGCFKDEISSKYQRDIHFSTSSKSLLANRLYLELLFETIPPSLRPEDRNTMSQSLESRSPFLDYRLVEYCFSLPNKFKIRNGLGKWVLREAMKGILPEDVRTRKDKAGFISPADEWFRTINRKQVYDLINSESFKNRGIFNIKAINELFEQHLKKEKNHQMLLWQIINIELWFKRFFGE